MGKLGIMQYQSDVDKTAHFINSEEGKIAIYR